MQRRPHSLSDHGAFHLALIAFVCIATALLSGSPPTRTDWPTRQIDDRVEQITAQNHAAVPMVSLDFHFAEGFHDGVVELTESTDDDDSKRCLLRLDAGLPLDAPALAILAALYESSAGRALTPFRLRAFSGRGSPSA